MCVLSVRHHWGALGCPLPPPCQYSLDLAECRSVIWAGWLGGETPSCPPPVAVLSWGEALAAKRAGLREEVPASVLSPRLVGRKQRCQALEEQGNRLATPLEGTKALALPESCWGRCY